MSTEIAKEIKEEIFKLISTPGIEIQDIVERVNLDYDTVINILSDEYFKCDLNSGRRMCCRF